MKSDKINTPINFKMNSIIKIVDKSITTYKKLNKVESYTPTISMSQENLELEKKLSKFTDKIFFNLNLGNKPQILIIFKGDIPINFKEIYDVAECIIVEDEIKFDDYDFKSYGGWWYYINKTKDLTAKLKEEENKEGDLKLEKFKDLPKPTVSYLDEGWEEEFFEWLRQFLTIVLPEEDVQKGNVEVFLQFRREWIRGMTHKSVKADREDNYEVFEKMGDKAFGYALVIYVLEVFGDADQGIITNIDQKIAATGGQSEIARRIGISNWLRIRPDHLTAGVREDALESFFGVLDWIMNKNSKVSIGYGAKVALNIYRMVMTKEYLLGKTDIHPVSYVEQLFQSITGLVVNKTPFLLRTVDENNVYSLYLTVKGNEYLQEKLEKFNIKIPNTKKDILLGRAKDYNGKTRKSKAYEVAKDYLKEKMGLDQDIIKEMKMVRDFYNQKRWEEFKTCVDKLYKIDYNQEWIKYDGKGGFHTLTINDKNGKKHILITDTEFEKGVAKHLKIKKLIDLYLDKYC